MVQRKVSKILGIQATNSLKTEKKQASTKNTLLNHDGKSKGADLKIIKMKKSRSIKRSDIEISLCSSLGSHENPQKPVKSPPFASPANTKNPKTPSSSSWKSRHGSPNYMKSTSSSEARKEQKKEKIISSTLELQSVAKTPSKMSSNLKQKVRNLTKAPSFKHKRGGTSKCMKNKVVLCDDFNVQKATCSSIMKDSKFPTYSLMPNDGAMKVCPYNYCSLNGHYHSHKPPLKCFLSSKRRILKTTQKSQLVPDVAVMSEVDQNENFFVEIFVPRRDISNDDVSSHTLPLPNPLQDQTSSECSYDGSNLDDTSEMVWEEGLVSATCHDIEDDVSSQSDFGGDQDEPGFFQSDDNVGHKVRPQYTHEEITECLNFNDADSEPESETTQPGEEQIEGLVTVKEDNNTYHGPENEIAEEYSPVAVDESGAGNGAEISLGIVTEHQQPGDKNLYPAKDSSMVKLNSHENSAPEKDTKSTGQTKELLDSCYNLKSTTRHEKADNDSEGAKREFEPREPNFLPIIPDPESEKVDLRHHEKDDRRNAEEWMVDYALRKAVNQLVPARKRKVALLVEAFESVMPISKCEPHLITRDSSGFAHARPIQACS